MKEATVRHSDESGEIMIESTIIVLLTTFILIFMVSLGFLYYQKSMINTVANETATGIGQMYRYQGVNDEDISSSTEMLSAMNSILKYRYIFWGFLLEGDNLEKADSYTVARLSKTSLATQEGEPTIQMNVNSSDFGRRYVEVTVEAKYSIFWGGALKAFGMEEEYVISSTAYAECNYDTI